MGLFTRRLPGGESLPRRVLLVTLAFIYSLTASGVVFGYSGIYSVLVYDVKAFSSLCSDTSIEALPCEAQASALSLMYTIGATTISACAFLVGIALDILGPRITVCLGSILLALGLVFVGIAQQVGDSLYYWGFFVMAVGGPCIFNSTYSFGELFPSQSAAIIGALSTGFNSSTIVLTTFSWAIQTLGISFRQMFLAYAALPVVVFLSSILLFPDEPFSSAPYLQQVSASEAAAPELDSKHSALGGSEEKETSGPGSRSQSVSILLPPGKGKGSEREREGGEAGSWAPSSSYRFNDELHRVWTVTLASEAKYPAEDVDGSKEDFPDGEQHDPEAGEQVPDVASLPNVNGTSPADRLLSPSLSINSQHESVGVGGEGGRSAATGALLRKRRSFLFDDGPTRIYNVSFREQIKSPVFWSMAVVTAFVVLRVNYYIMSLNSQLLAIAKLHHPGDTEAAIRISNYYSAVFNYMLPPGGILMIPVVGYVMVNLGFVSTFLIIAVIHMLFCIANLNQLLPVSFQIVSFCFYAMLRPFVFGGMAAYIGRLFGFVNFGKLYGLVRVTGACAVALEYPLQNLTIGYFQGNYYFVNLGFLLVGLLLFVFPVYLWKVVFDGNFFRPPVVELPRH